MQCDDQATFRLLEKLLHEQLLIGSQTPEISPPDPGSQAILAVLTLSHL
jgi:hypothetical protein